MENVSPETKRIMPENRSLILSDDFVGDLNRQIWDLRKIEAGRWSIDSVAGRNCLKVTVNKGDRLEVNPNGQITERSEVGEAKELLLPPKTPIWYGFSFYFPPDFAIIDNRLIFAQWKQRTGKKEGPFLSFRYKNGKLIFQVEYDDESLKFPKKNDLRGSWHDILLHYELEKKETGTAQAWVDGDLFAQYQGKMGYKPPRDLTYFKMGLYRNQAEIPQTVYFSRFRRGPTREFCEK